MQDLLIRNVTLEDQPTPIDMLIHEGRIVKIGRALSESARAEMDLGGRLIIPGFVDSHVHLDIAMMNDTEKRGREKPFRSPVELNQEVERRRLQFTRQDIERRAAMALDLAARHGVTAMRAQCHVDPEVGLRHLEALLSVRERYSGRIDLQIVAFPQQGFFQTPGGPDLFREAFKLGADVMGCASNLERVPMPDFRQHIDMAFQIAMEFDVDLDMHADLGIPPSVTLEQLEVVYAARKAIELGYQGRVTAGHACALDSATPEIADSAIQLMLDARMNVISQPDMYRLGREDTSHVRRGLTRVKSLLAAGINVAFASNNVRDGYRPLGNFDMLEEGLVLAYGAHMDSVSELETLLQMATINPARIMKLPGYGLGVGSKADFVILDAFNASAALADQAEKLFVFKNGQLIARNTRSSQLY